MNGRVKYTIEEKRALLKYTRDNPHMKPMSDNLWKKAQSENLTQHTWSSMKEHYKKTIHPNLNNWILRCGLTNQAPSDDPIEEALSQFPSDDFFDTEPEDEVAEQPAKGANQPAKGANQPAKGAN
eukprot:Trichotokara_eunicae@DN1598_c0_g1_i1.p1